MQATLCRVAESVYPLKSLALMLKAPKNDDLQRPARAAETTAALVHRPAEPVLLSYSGDCVRFGSTPTAPSSADPRWTWR